MSGFRKEFRQKVWHSRHKIIMVKTSKKNQCECVLCRLIVGVVCSGCEDVTVF